MPLRKQGLIFISLRFYETSKNNLTDYTNWVFNRDGRLVIMIAERGKRLKDSR